MGANPTRRNCSSRKQQDPPAFLRDQVLVRFSNRSCSVLVATDVAARGLDIAQLETVINVDITPEAEVHIHRIGRTGRADEEGWAFSLVSMDEMGRVGRIEQLQGPSEFHPLSELEADTSKQSEPLRPPMVTLQILGGRKEKIRAGDVLGALTKDMGFTGAQIGKININDFSTYVVGPAKFNDVVIPAQAGIDGTLASADWIPRLTRGMTRMIPPRHAARSRSIQRALHRFQLARE